MNCWSDIEKMVGLGKDLSVIKKQIFKMRHFYTRLYDNTKEIQLETVSSVNDSKNSSILDEIPVESPPYKLWKTILLSVLVGLTICFYSIDDKLGVSTIDPVTYIFSFYIITGILFTPYALWRHKQDCKDAIKNFKKKYIVLVGVASCGAYLAILFAFQWANASYIVAIREVSVVIGSVMGILILKEKINLIKGIGISSIATGLVLVKLA